eukprot:CAMPEP_0179921912 /NCGR_PEP_ID=MMETSP0983-20121128/5324_1 /TAXON_ID=483367 /ORGANISM="non described non described, Strain CCMP 2436" /LENGTH=45 /DNA_ID= /DNA_START= /DNA_END= /DNA_ORIENTATION=
MDDHAAAGEHASAARRANARVPGFRRARAVERLRRRRAAGLATRR